MNKTAVKNFAVQARITLIKAVKQKAYEYDITPDAAPGAADVLTTAAGRILTETEKEQREQLINSIAEKGYEQVMEEAAYTWFNRFIALRFMEVNGYLPSRVRIFTDEDNKFEPQILKEALDLDIEGIDMNRVYELKSDDDEEALYKYLFITQCNALSSVLPGMFQKIEDCTELLLPDRLLSKGSVIDQMVTSIPEEDWKDEVQIIGWLYQYYISEKKDEVFAALKKNIKITKENIPAATQLFTPDWIVRYMVENSLGRLWIEGHPDCKSQLLPDEEEKKAYLAYRNLLNGVTEDDDADSEQYAEKYDADNDRKWHYYLEEAEQEPEVQAKLDEIRKEYAAMTPEQLKVIDPCCGSGHILAYMFDVLVQIYETNGYTKREAVSNIIQNNLYGLDIDERAAQLAYFAVMMKGCQYDRRFLTRGVQPHVYAIEESNHLDKFAVEYFCNGNAKLKEAMDTIISELHDAKEYGSILKVTQQDWYNIYDRFAEIKEDINMSRDVALAELLPMAQVAEVLSKKYDAVVTNPPYMGASNMNPKLNEFIKQNYADYKSDFFSAFVIHCSEMTKKSGYCGFFTPYVWMFIQSYEKMRNYLYTQATIETLIQFEYSAFEEATVPVCTFVFQNCHLQKNGCYLRLVDFRGGMEVQRQKTLEAIRNHNCGFYYEQNTDNFSKIPGSPVAYWLSPKAIIDFEEGKALGKLENVCGGLTTGDNNRFLRLWFEVNFSLISFDTNSMKETEEIGYTWYPMTKGGDYRKWYGNNEYIVNWKNNGKEIKYWVTHNPKDPNTKHWSRRLFNTESYFKSIITWSGISSGIPSMRISDHSIFGSGAKAIVPKGRKEFYIAYLNSNVALMYLRALSPTLNYESGHIASLPVIEVKDSKILGIVQNNMKISKLDWDSLETSWDFQRNPLC